MDAKNPVYSSANGVLFDKNQTMLISFPPAKAGDYTVPDGVVTIANAAFQHCALTGVSIPNTVISIGDAAFLYCSNLTNVTLPNSILSIGSNAFSSSKLTQINLPDSIQNIGTWAFMYCGSLRSIFIPKGVTNIQEFTFYWCKSLTSISIPNSVTSIARQAFDTCSSLKNVTIPSSVTSMDLWAFAGCTSLDAVVFIGDAPSMGDGVFYNTAKSFTVYYFDGKKGFTSSTWNDGYDTYQSVNMGAYSPVKPWLISNGFAYNANLTSTPNGDGVPLLLSYALNLDPTKNQSRSVPKVLVVGNRLCMTYYAANPDVTYTVQTSPDLQTWTTGSVTISGPDANGTNLRIFIGKMSLREFFHDCTANHFQGLTKGSFARWTAKEAREPMETSQNLLKLVPFGPDANGCYTASIAMTDARRFMRLVVTH